MTDQEKAERKASLRGRLGVAFQILAESKESPAASREARDAMHCAYWDLRKALGKL